MNADLNSMPKESLKKIESITIVPATRLSPVERVKRDISETDFIELRVVSNSPKDLEIKKIEKGVKPTKGFRDAIERANLLDTQF